MALFIETEFFSFEVGANNEISGPEASNSDVLFHTNAPMANPQLFVHLGGCYKGQPVHDFRKAWSHACDKVGLVGMLRHDFRRSAVRNMERAGVPRSVAMKISGHKTESIYRRYAIVSESDIQDATRRLLSRAQNGHTTPSSVDSALISG